jgi:hypothetical protein
VRRAALLLLVALALPGAAIAQEVDLKFGQSVTVRGTKIDYVLDLGLAAMAPTRIGVDATVDLTDLQRRLPALLAGTPVVDNCGVRIALQSIEADAEEEAVIVTGRLDAELFDCERTGAAAWQRGATERVEEIDFRAAVSAELREGCVVFLLRDLDFTSQENIPAIDTGSGRVAAARTLLVEAAGVLLEEVPFCPALPAELAVLDPTYESGVPEEIGDGGLGVALRGSIDASTTTVLAVLRLLQERGVLPPRP